MFCSSDSIVVNISWMNFGIWISPNGMMDEEGNFLRSPFMIYLIVICSLSIPGW